MKDIEHLIAHQFCHGPDIQGFCHGLAHAVEDREFIHARVEFPGSFFDLLLKALRPLRIIQRDRRLVCQHAKHVAVGFIKPAIKGVHIDIQVAEDLVLDDQGRDNPAQPGFFGQG